MQRIKNFLEQPVVRRSRFSQAHLAAFILIFGAIGSYILLSSHAATSAANVFVSPNGSDSGVNCKRFAAAQTNPDSGGTTLCASFDKAYQLASPGDTVEVENGAYSSQLIPYTSAKPNNYHCDWSANNDIYKPVADYSGCITFVPAASATVTLGGLDFEVPYFRLDGGASKSFRFDRTSSVASYKFDYCEIVSPKPALSVSLSGTVTAGSNKITGLPSTAGLIVGHGVMMTTGNEQQLPAGTKIISIDSSSQVTVSNNATQTATGTLAFDTGQVVISGNLTSGSPVVSGIASTTYLAPRQVITGTGIPAGTTIVSVDSANQLTLSQNATATTNASLTVAVGCYYGSAGISFGSLRTNAYTCYGLTGKPQEQGHDDVITNVWSNDAFGLSGAHNALINSTFDIGDTWRPDSGSSHMEGCRDTVLGQTAPGDYLELDHVSIENALLTHNANQCDLSGPPCPTGWMSYHVAPLHWEGGTNSRVVRSLFENNGAHNIELEPEDGYPTADNLLMENNIFGALCSNQPVAPSGYCASQGGAQITDCHSTGGTVSNVVYRFNTDIGSGQNGFSHDNPNCNWGGQLIDYANLNTDAAPDASSFACTNQISQPGVSWAYNLWASGGTSPCGSNTVIGNPALANTNYPVDAHLQNTSQAIDAVPAGGSGFTACPATDYYGNVRPQGSACDIGASEFVAPASLANVFVAPNGSDSGTNCKRFAAAISNPDSGGTSLCKTFQKAYDIMSPGDTVELEAGNYAQQTIMRNSQSQSGPMTTFKCAAVKQCIINGSLVLGANNGGPTGVGPSYLTFDGIDAAQFYMPEAGIDTNSVNQPIPAVQSTNVTITNSWFHHWGCCSAGNSQTLILASPDNLTIKNTELGPACCSGDGIEAGGWYDPVSGTVHNQQNLTIDGIYVHDLFDTCSNRNVSNGLDEGAGTLYPAQCSGTGYGDNTNAGYDHNDGIQLYGGDNVIIKNSKWIRAGTQAIFVALYQYSLNGLTIQNNMVSNVLNGGFNDFSIGSQAGPGKIHGTINILYNSVQKTTGFGLLNCTPGQGVCYPSYDSTDTINIVGNIFNSYTNGNVGTTSACNLWAYNLSNSSNTQISPNYSHNLINGAVQNGSASPICGDTTNGTPTYVNTSYFNPDLHLVAGSTGVDLGESVFCGAGKQVSTDIDGGVRPQGAACDVGADELGANGSKPGDLNSDGSVNILDLSIMLSHYGMAATAPQGDIDSDGTVTVIDLSILLSHYGT